MNTKPRFIPVYKERLGLPVFKVAVCPTFDTYDVFYINGVDRPDAYQSARILYPDAEKLSVRECPDYHKTLETE